jgi:uracil-DNA glycosylase family 4
MLKQILDALSACLECEVEDGNVGATVAPEVMAGLKKNRQTPPGEAPRAPARAPAAAAPAAKKAAQPSRIAAAGGADDKVASPDRSMAARRELEAIAREVAQCTACGLSASRTRTVPGQGCPQPEIVFVGEGPGADEDREGLAFVGRAGQLLTKMIEAMGLTRDEVFICNVVKCRPPDNRTPELPEMAACVPYLKRQIAILKPRVIVALGATALKGLIEMPEGTGITKLRGTFMSFGGIDLMPTFHPAYLLRNPTMKKYVWEDLKTVLRHIGRAVPDVKSRDPG